MIYLYIADKSDDATINRDLPESFVLRALSYKNDEQRADSLRGYRLIYGALCELGYGDRTEIRTGVYGKPYITDCPYRFSLSHSYGKSFCAVGRVEVGCDVEKIREIDLSIAKRFFSSDESDRVFSFSDKDAKKSLRFQSVEVKPGPGWQTVSGKFKLHPKTRCARFYFVGRNLGKGDVFLIRSLEWTDLSKINLGE